MYSYSSVAVIYLQNTQQKPYSNNITEGTIQDRFSKLLQDIQILDYKLHTVTLNVNEESLSLLENTLKQYLRIYDIVLVIGCLNEGVFRAATNVYDEHWEVSQEFALEINENAHYRHLQTIEEKQNHVLWLHRFYFIDCNCLDSDFTKFLLQLKYFKKKPIYSKVFKYELNEKVQKYIDCLVCCENGIKTTKLKDNEIVVSSTSLDAINNLQKQLEINFTIESCWAVEENEEKILSSTCSFIQEAINLIKDCFDTYKPENVFISFNGGKDCTVLLHLMLIILKKYYPEHKQPVFCMYVQSKKPFPQVNDFINTVKSYYGLDMHTLTAGIKDGLSEILHEKPNLKACLMGTRRTDPFSANLRHFQATDNGWPEIMRVSPLLDWEFSHVWDYLINFKVPYCNLYDEGYTSLGNIDNTLKNPQLLNEDTGEYYPAYKLLTSTKERSGRM